jgi:hydroxymethylbilane synthase
LADQPALDGLVLASAGLDRLGIRIDQDGQVAGAASTTAKDRVPQGLLATVLSVDQMLPCVGQGAIGLEGRHNDDLLKALFERLNDADTWHCVLAERAFLRAMGGGCLSPVAAYAERIGARLRLRAVSFRGEKVRRDEELAPLEEAVQLGERVAEELKETPDTRDVH